MQAKNVFIPQGVTAKKELETSTLQLQGTEFGQ